MNTLLPLVALVLANPPAEPLHCPAPLSAKGDVKGGPPLAHTFEMTHRAAAGAITITKLETGCGCLRHDLSAHTLRPGETTKLTLEVNTLTQPDGPNRWQVQVHYRFDPPAPPGGAPAAPQTGVIPLTITATISREVSVTPPQVAFSATGEASQVLTITDRRGRPLPITKVVTTAKHLTAELGSPKDATQTVTLKLAADAPPGHRDETVSIFTSDPAYPELRVPVRVLKRAAGAVTATPSDIAVRFASGQDEVSALVQLRTPDGKPLRIETAQSDHANVTLKWSKEAAPIGAIRVSVGGAAAMQAGTAKVSIRFAEPTGQELVLPVSWTVAGRK